MNSLNASAKRIIIIVLGMHRSGTSAITKGLENLGLELGNNLLPPVPGDNDRGYFEDLDFNRLNELIFEAAGCTWDSLSSLDERYLKSEVFDELRQKACSLVRQKTSTGDFCVKDPRFSVLLPFWLNVFKETHVEPKFVLAVRNPVSVVSSLQSGLRGDIPSSLGYYLWLRYNIEPLYYLVSYKPIVVAFESMLVDSATQLNRIGAALSSDEKPSSKRLSEYANFLDKKLVRNASSTEALAKAIDTPSSVLDLYSLLQKLAKDEVGLTDSETQSAVLGFHESLKADALLFKLTDRLKRQNASLLNTIHNIDQPTVQLAREHATLIEQYELLEKEAEDLTKALQDKSDEIGRYHHALTNALETIKTIHKSRSWIYTQPLRTALHQSKRIGKLVRNSQQATQHLVTRDNLQKFHRLIQTYGLIQATKFALRRLVAFNEHAHSLHSSVLSKIEDYLPSLPKAAGEPYNGTVDVIIPIYKGFEFTKNCIDSVLKARSEVSHRIIIINDASPELAVTQLIEQLKSNPNLIILENTTNLGFVKTVNKGMCLSNDNDVILLNSDTEVADYWIDRIVRHTLINPKVATITPFSNNATICSFPTIYGKRTLPSDSSLERMNASFYAANRDDSIEIPTGVGFCMYIARSTLNDVGLFDEEAFGKGYGEENDFCLRAAAKGWKNLLACDVFVFHAGEVSFQSSSNQGKANALKVLSNKYPDYEEQVSAHVIKAEANRHRIRAGANIFKHNGKTTVLMTTHALGGGTQKHVDELIESLSFTKNIVLINPVPTRESIIQVHLTIQGEQLSFNFDTQISPTGITEFLASCGVTRIHFHHVIGLSPELLDALRSYGKPFDFTVHDYYTICPRINLIQDDIYCGEKGVAQCNTCLTRGDLIRPIEIIEWRNRHNWLITDAEQVICPSDDALQRMRKHFPSGRFIKRFHEESQPFKPIRKTRNRNGAVTVAILGVLSVHKGSELVRELIKLVVAQNAQVNFVTIGTSQGLIKKNRHYRETGPYEAAQIPALIESVGPDIILFPARWPETYSYTLSEAMHSGAPILAPDIGSFPERLAHYPLGRIYPHTCSAASLLDHIFSLYDIEIDLAYSSDLIADAAQSIPEFYDSIYGPNESCRDVVNLCQESLRSAVIIAEGMDQNGFSPCAYIRLILPLLGGQFGKYDTVRIVRQAEATTYIADDFYTHRVAIDQENVSAILDHCQKYSINLYYDIDDDLLSIAQSSHPERKVYAAHSQTIAELIKAARNVSVSTEALALKINGLRPNLTVRSNCLSKEVISTTRDIVRHRSIGIVYMGTQTHDADLKIVLPALSKIKLLYGEAVTIYLVGVTNKSMTHRGFEVLSPPTDIARSYPLFMQWLAQLDCFDIGIAPLAESEFNTCKSDIKFLDYSAIQIATIASSAPAYAQTIENKLNGLLVHNTTEAWIEALVKLIEEPDTRLKLAENAHRYLMAHRSY